jgi:hypothetical protein
MSSSNSRTKTAKPMIGLRVEPDLQLAIESAAQASGRTISQEINVALRRIYIESAPTVDSRIAHVEQLVARFDGRHRADARATKEMLGSFVYLFFLYNPELPDDNKRPAHSSALRRLEKFIRSVSKNLKEGQSLLTIDEREPVPEGLHSDEVQRETKP